MKTWQSLLLGALGGGLAALTASAQPLRSPEVHPDGRVTFRFAAPKATEVTVKCEGVGESAMTNAGQGVWTYTTQPLAADIYAYSFTADGLHLLDPGNAALKYNLINPESLDWFEKTKNEAGW